MKRALLAAAAALALAAPAACANQLVEIALPARGGEISEHWIPRVPGPPKARVLLPDGYDPKRAYPLLLLLEGLNSTYRFWSDPGQGEVAKTAAGLNAIVVMPEAGDGWYADWWNGGRRGAPRWESYYLDQVIPQIEERYRIRRGRRWHAVAGDSMGGLGAAYLGGRLPGYFGSVAVLSGLVDLQLIPGTANVMSLISTANAGAPALSQTLGSWTGFYATGHNPPRLAANLAHTRVYMAAGNGQPCADSSRGGNVLSDLPAEMAIIKPSSDSYAAALKAAGVDLSYQPHCGFHDWPNFRRELRDAIRWGLFEPVDEHPSSWVADTVATHGKLWDIAYAFDPPPDGVVRFRRRGAQLLVSGAHTTVTVTRGRCVLRAALPSRLTLPLDSARCRSSSSRVARTR